MLFIVSFYFFLIPVLLYFFLLFLAIFYFRNRSGSSHSLLARFYALISGSNKFHDLGLEEFWQTRQDVERFNALFNVGAKNIGEVKRFNQWVDSYGLDINKISNTSGFIAIDSMRISKIKRKSIALCLLTVAVTLVLSVIFLSVGASNHAVVKMRDGGQWFGLNKEEAIRKNYNPFSFKKVEWIITPRLCESKGIMKSESVIKSGIEQKGVDFICASFNNGRLIKEVNDIKKKQKALIFVAFMLFLFTWVKISQIIRFYKIEQARKYIDKECHSHS
ncbi:DUF6216 family protein [Cobetia marina]